MYYCTHCYLSDNRHVPVKKEHILAGHRAFRCRWCGTLSGNAISGRTIMDRGTIPADRFTTTLQVTNIQNETSYEHNNDYN